MFFNRQQLRHGSFTEVFVIALPLILSNSCHAVNMFFDRLMLAKFSNEAVSAAFTGGLTNFTIACIFVGTIGYTGTFVAQYEGAARPERIGRAVWQGIWMAFIGGALLYTGVWWAQPLFEFFGHEPAIVVEEVRYFHIMSKGSFIFLLTGALACFWTGRGKTVEVLAVSFLITLFNLPLNYIFIFGTGIIPAMGTAGAAWGTIGSEFIGVMIYMCMFLSPSSRKHFATGKPVLDLNLLKRMLRFGLPSGIHLAIDLIAFNTFSLLLGCYGASVHEASSITFGINNIALSPVIGIGMTASILAGQAMGAENIPLAKRSMKNCTILVTIYSLLMVLLFSVFQNLVLDPFARPDDPSQQEAMRLSSQMLYFISAYLVFDGFNIVISNVLRGAGDTRFPMWTLTIVGLLLFALPCWILYKLQFPWWALWIVLELEILLLAVIFMLRYISGKWTKFRVIETKSATPATEQQQILS